MTTTLSVTADGLVVDIDGVVVVTSLAVDDVFRAADPHALVYDAHARVGRSTEPAPGVALAPIGHQEVWAAGVTYEVSRSARVEESEAAADVYERVYAAARPELFFKSTARRVVGPGGHVRIRADSAWNVPEPELTLAVSSHGTIFGVTIGNDMSSRDIEGENPLYLPQAKVYDGSAALGPHIVLVDDATGWPAATNITLDIVRTGEPVFSGSTSTERIRRPFAELVEYLFRDQTFPDGCFLMTGAGVVPDAGFTLLDGDEVSITIGGIGTLRNTVRQSSPVTAGETAMVNQ